MIVVSHRGPFLFSIDDDGHVVANRGPGGLAGTLHSLATASDALDGARCVSAALSEGDRAVVRGASVPPLRTEVVLLDIDPAVHQQHYEIVSNEILWFLFHGLFDLVHRPTFDESFHEAWQAYGAVNRTFADAVIERAEHGETVLVHDYPLALVPGMLRAARPDLRIAYFTHTPFCGPSSIGVLPDDVARALCESMAAVSAGFHTGRWSRAYLASAAEVLGEAAGRASTFVAPLGPDPDALAHTVASETVATAAADLAAELGDLKVIFRTDRVDPAKNIVRGFLAYDHLLETRPEWRERVAFVAMLTPSRGGLPEYVAYDKEVVDAVSAVNERWGTDAWQPIMLDARDDFERSVAAYTRYDVLYVNSLKDGLNLVAKEGPLVNERDGVLCLSPGTGAYDELHEAALSVHPWDIAQSAAALHEALAMGGDERKARAQRLRALARQHNPREWLGQLIEHAR